MTESTRRRVARWESPRGRYWCELYEDRHGYGYDADNAGGFLGRLSSDSEARGEMEPRLVGLFPGRYAEVGS